MTKLPAEAYAIIEGRHSDPFRYLGLHTEGDKSVVRAFLPQASNVEAIGEHGETAKLARIHDAGLFTGTLPNGSKRYQLRARYGDNVVELDDPYRFPPVLSDFDLYLLGEGTDQRLYDKLGAHPLTIDGVDGVAFVVFAPNARRVSVVGDFNFWDARRHPMRVRGVGYWELFIPRAMPGDHYKFDIIGPNGQHLPLKSDPLAFATEMRPKTASIVFDERSIPHPRPAPSGVARPSRRSARCVRHSDPGRGTFCRVAGGAHDKWWRRDETARRGSRGPGRSPHRSARIGTSALAILAEDS